MANYLVIHEHNEGVTIYRVTTDHSLDLYQEMVEVENEYVAGQALLASLLGINFEPWKGEAIIVTPYEPIDKYISHTDWDREVARIREDNSRSF